MITKLDPYFTKYIKSEYIKIAVALINREQCKRIIEVSNTSMISIVTGIDLNTHPKVLQDLLDHNIEVKINHTKSRKIHFHPKVYLFSDDGEDWTGFVGSANLTNGGMSDNVEMTLQSNQDQAFELVTWFDELYGKAEELTQSFIDDYKLLYKERKKAESAIEDSEDRFDKIINSKSKKAARMQLIENIKYMLNERSEEQIMTDDRHDVKSRILAALDFNNEFTNIDLDSFFSIAELGRVVYLNKSKIDVSEFRENLRSALLTDQSLDVQYDTIIQTNGAGSNITSKVLCALNPEDAFLWNRISETVLSRYDIHCPSYRNGKNYIKLNQEVLSLAHDAGMKNMIALDWIFYRLHDLLWSEYWQRFLDWDQGDLLRPNRVISENAEHNMYIRSKNNIEINLNGNKSATKPYIYVSIDFKGSEAKMSYDSFVRKYPKDLHKLFYNNMIEFDRNEDKVQSIIRIKKYVSVLDRVDWPNQFEWMSDVAKKALEVVENI